MKEQKTLLEKRRQIKKKKPAFVRKEYHRKKKLSGAWRRPKGLHNKQRLKRKSHSPNPSSGYRAPSRVRRLHKSGLIPVLISNINQLDSIRKEQGIILSSHLGNKKRALLIREIKKRSLALLNLDADKTLTRIESQIKERQEIQKKKLQKRREKKKGIEEKVKKEEVKKEKEEKEKPELTEEEKKKLEKQEKDKLLTKKT